MTCCTIYVKINQSHGNILVISNFNSKHKFLKLFQQLNPDSNVSYLSEIVLKKQLNLADSSKSSKLGTDPKKL